MASDWQNPLYSADVNDDGQSNPLDALLIINAISRQNRSTTLLYDLTQPVGTNHYYDVNGDQKLLPLDALRVVNQIARNKNAISVTVGLVNDSGASKLDQITNDAHIAGKIPAASAKNTTLKARLDRGDIFDLTVDAQGNFALSDEILTQISEGKRNLKIAATDVDGRRGLNRVSFVFDTTSPDLTSAGLIAADDSGVKSNDSVTNVKEPRIRAAKESDTTISLQIDGKGAYQGAARPDGLYKTSVLADGSHQILVTATDLAGNSSTHRSTIVIDTKAPTPPLIGFAASSAVAGSGTTKTPYSLATLEGSTEGDSFLSIDGRSVSVRTAGDGSFRIPNVGFELGDNKLSFTVMDLAGNQSKVEKTLSRVASTSENQPVLVWNQAILNAIQLDATAPPIATRGMAMMGIAVFDTINSIEKKAGFLVKKSAPAVISLEAAVSTAAYTVLSYLYPGQQAGIDEIQNEVLSKVANGAAKTNGIAFGKLIAESVIAIRANDGWNRFVDYLPDDEIGKWQPTAPMYDVPQLPQWGQLETFAIDKPEDFVPAAPPALDSAAYAASVNEVKLLGSRTSTKRTADQTEIARFWADGGGTYTPPGHWNLIALQLAEDKGLSIGESARLFAMLNTALSDSSVVAWKTKYQYELWRPIDAIHNAADDNNDKTTADPNWQPFLLTPPHPEYVSGHSTFSGAGAEILSNYFGPNTSFKTTSLGLPGVERSFASFAQAADEAGRSRIYGGIHYEFSNQNGQATGRAVADATIARFNLSDDLQAPTILFNSSADSLITATSPTVQGNVFDNLSGVKLLERSIDGGAYAAVTVAADGSFSVPAGLAINGSKDGSHVITFRATDAAGNVSELQEYSFVLDTLKPTITVSEPIAKAVLTADSRLAGTVSGTGSPLVSLTYKIDTGKTIALPLTSTGTFDVAIDSSSLAKGNHTIEVSAKDSAGNSQVVKVAVVVSAQTPLRLTKVTPMNGDGEIGVTFRPQIFFSRPIDPDTLTSNNFFATDATGTAIPAKVVPSADGRFAWLFFDQPLPSASAITITVKGGSIRSADGTQTLDADNDGQSSGNYSYTFTTVSLVPVENTSLTGKIVDPGRDLKPMTFDDLRGGPDGALHTSDDVFLNPIAGATVYIIGLEGSPAITDADGNFHFDKVPAGNIKLVIDGRTATNAPEGFYFPEMVMDLQMVVGRTNTVMGSMGTSEERNSNLDRAEVYLPRLQESILKTVSDTAVTQVGVDAVAAPNLTQQQRDQLQLEVQPGSVIGPDGNPVSAAKVGISTVPPELVRDMLPPGLLQHTFDITIQAPEAATFNQPLQMTFPNVFNAEPGTKLNFLSFDHTTGRLVIEGTATVSADGLTVTTDAGTGITKPGWHGVTPPGDQTSGPKPPPPPPCPQGSTWKYVQDAVDLGVAAARCAVDLAGVGEWLDALTLLPAKMNRLMDDIRNLEAQAKSGSTAAQLGGALQLLNGQKVLLVDLAERVQRTSPLGKIEGAIECAKSILGSMDNICNRHLTKVDGCDSTVLTILCTGVEKVNQVIKIADYYKGKVKDGLKGIALKAVCDAIDFLAKKLQEPPKPAAASSGAEGEAVVSAEILAAIADLLAVGDTYNTELQDNIGLADAIGNSIEGLNETDSSAATLQATWFGLPVNAYYAFEIDGFVVRGRVDGAGQINAFLPANRSYTLTVYDATQDRIAFHEGTTGDSGIGTEIPYLSFGRADAVDPLTQVRLFQDTDGDRLVDLAEFAIGTAEKVADTDKDGVNDFAEVQKGSDPLGSTSFTTGVVTSLALDGFAMAIAIAGSSDNFNQQTAFIANGDAGLAVVDISQADKPVLLNSLSLAGNAVDVTLDRSRSIAVVASSEAGVHILDTLNPKAPTLLKQIATPSSATSVEVYDGQIYVGSIQSNSIDVYESRSGELLASLKIGSPVVDMVREGDRLYAVTAASKLMVIDLSNLQPTILSSLSLPQPPSNVSVLNGILYITTENGFAGGFMSVDATDSSSLKLVSGVDATNIGGHQLALNGSGLGVLIGVIQGTSVVDVVGLANPANTGNFLTRITLPLVNQQTPQAIAIAGGVGFIVAGTDGLVIVNYQSPDTRGVAPTATVSSSVQDQDSTAVGVQLVEGQSVPVKVVVADDQQVRSVELIVNGVVTQSSVSLPFDFNAIVPSLDTGDDRLTIQVRATDTGGNSTLSNVLTYQIIKDNRAPVLLSSSPSEGKESFDVPAIALVFDEAIDLPTLSLTGMELLSLGADGIVGGGDDQTIELGSFDTRLSGRQVIVLPSSSLETGKYRFTIQPTIVSDRGGNQIANPIVVNFTVLSPSDLKATSGTPTISRAPSANVGQEIGFRFLGGVDHHLRLMFPTIDSGGNVGEVAVAPSRLDPNANLAYFVVPSNAYTGEVVAGRINQLNFDAFDKWTVTDGTVDLLGPTGENPLQLSHSYIDLAGTSSKSGRLTTLEEIVLTPGDYELKFDLAGSPYNGESVVEISLGDIYSENLTLAFADPLKTFTRTIKVTQLTTARLSFQDQGNDNLGAMLAGVSLKNKTTSNVVFSDDFAFNFPEGNLPLQIVPTVTGVFMQSGTYNGGRILLQGSGFVEGGITISMGSVKVVDTSPDSTVDVRYNFQFENDGVAFDVPSNAPTGPITVTTNGGTSVIFPRSFSEIVSTATLGSSANPSIASANPGQAITLRGTGFDMQTDVIFASMDSGGTQSQRRIRPIAVNTDGTEIVIVVPVDSALTGDVAVVGDRDNKRIPLQIVPFITDYQFINVSSDGTSATVQLRGKGFIEGNNSAYKFGSVTLTDTNTSGDPIDVGYYFEHDNDGVRLTLPLTGNFDGSVTVTTAGGTSQPFGNVFSGIVGTAMSGTPLDATKASANPGQVITLTGSGFTGTTDILAQYMNGNGDVITRRLDPLFVNIAGTEIAVQVPNEFNGTYSLRIVGASTKFALQIVPDVNALHVISNGGVQLKGSGFVEGNNTQYSFTGGTVTDSDTSSSPIDVGAYFRFDNDGAQLSLPTHGFGPVTVETAGGTSAPINAEFVHPGVGRIYDVAFGSGNIYVATDVSILTIDPDTGKTLKSFALPGAASGNTGLQILPAAMSLAGVNVPAGSLLVTNGADVNDRIYALNPTTGAVLATLQVDGNYDAVAGLYDPVSKSIFLLSSPDNSVVVINPATGAQVRSFTLPFDVFYGGMALHPTTGNLWIGTSQSNSVYQYKTDGTAVSSVDLNPQDLNNDLNGLAFDANANLLAGSNFNVIKRFKLNTTTNAAKITSITAVAKDGTPASTTLASANAGQVIELSGTNFTPDSILVFSTRDSEGTVSTARVSPTVVNASGTKMQAIVPILAQTGDVSIEGGTGNLKLQIVPSITSIIGAPGFRSEFTIQGSGFMEGGTTVKVGGTTFVDQYVSSVDGDIYGSYNDQFKLKMPLSVEAPITVITAGGSFTFSTTEDALPPFVELTNVLSVAASGIPADAQKASANVDQIIELVGRGFSGSTQVAFEAVDDQGVVGRLIVGGQPNDDGTRLTLRVPTLARTGNLRVIGSDTAIPLQIVPKLRSWGGDLVAGSKLILEGSGLVEGDLKVTIDGKAVAKPNVISTYLRDFGSSDYQSQQIVDLTAPSGISAGSIRVTTAGGSFTLQPRTLITTAPDINAAQDTGSTLDTAMVLNVGANSSLTVISQSIGDSPLGSRDVDLFRISANAGDILKLVVTPQNAGFYSHLRLFDENGEVITSVNSDQTRALLDGIAINKTGTYYIGVSGYYNHNYDPLVYGSGNEGYHTGVYRLQVERSAGARSSLTSISSTLASGTASRATIAAANVGQTITLRGQGFQTGDRVAFTVSYSDENLTTRIVDPTSIAADGKSLTVVVPPEAVTGAVRLEREEGGIFLQIVPTIIGVDSPSDQFHDRYLYIQGSGFSEAGISANFGSKSVTGRGVYNSLDVSYFFSQYNDGVRLVVPGEVPVGPISVTTLGGTSQTYDLTFTSITATAASGVPANATLPSANPGQAITIKGTGLQLGTDILFPAINGSGIVFERIVRPVAVSADGTQATVIVPVDVAYTGSVTVVGERTSKQLPLQIVPVITQYRFNSISSDGKSADVQLRGLGFVEGNNSTYKLGAITVVDPDTSPSTVDVGAYYSYDNDGARIALNIAGSFDGPVTVKTAGGTSAPFEIGYTGLVGTALSGTPADATKASANPGQAMILTGSDFNMETGIVTQYWDGSGELRSRLLKPFFVNAQGTELAFQVPNDFNGSYFVRVLGSPNKYLLQVVPQVESFSVGSNSQILLRGRGFVEGRNTKYLFAGGSITDTLTDSSTVDVGAYFRFDNDGANFALPIHGFGQLTVQTVAGTSEPINLELANPKLGTLYDVAFGSGNLYVATNTSIMVVDPATGKTLKTFSMPGGASGNTGLQIVPAAMKLAGVDIPAGSLLVTNGSASFDQIIALDSTSGTILAALDLGQDFDAVAGVYDAATDSLFILNPNTDQVVKLDPATGAIVSSFDTSMDIYYGGLAIDPQTGNLWIGTSRSNKVAEFTKDGVAVREIDLAPRGLNSDLSGMAFDASGNLLVSLNTGVVRRFSLSESAKTPKLTSINASAIDGTPAAAGTASANVAQVIQISGENLSFDTQVLFSIRQIDGSIETLAVSPTAVKNAGTLIQVVVPDLAQTGDVTLANGDGSQTLQIVPVISSIEGAPGSRGTFVLRGSGFMEGASTLKIGGETFADQYINLVDGDVFGSRNDSIRLVVPLTVEGPITITTPGGSFTIAGPSYSLPAFARLTGIQSVANVGQPADPSKASANVDQFITLIGQGFNSETRVQFEAVDDQGVAGTIVRAGNVSPDGTSIQIAVPTLARTGTVRVIGAPTGVPLQIVPTLSSFGGVISAGNKIVLEGTGLIEGNLTVTIDGKAVTTTDVIATADRENNSDSYFSQQIVDLTVPAGVSAGVIKVTTAGGSVVLRPESSIATLTDVAISSDIGDTLATAATLTMGQNTRLTVTSQAIGDSAVPNKDVDLYKFTASAGDILNLSVIPQNQGLYTYLRLFDAAGAQVASATSSSTEGVLNNFHVTKAGTYYLGVSGYYNQSYDPKKASSGSDGSYTGAYRVQLSRSEGIRTSISSITSTLGGGTAARSTVAAANVGQTITLNGQGFKTGDRVAFVASYSNEFLTTVVVDSVSVTPDGKKLTVVVPAEAVSGQVRLLREEAGVFLQVVPTLEEATLTSAQYFDGSLRLKGSGFSESTLVVQFDTQQLIGSGPYNQLNVGYLFNQYNDGVSLVVPVGVATGPITVSTLGGTSQSFSLDSSVAGLTLRTASATYTMAAALSSEDEYSSSTDEAFADSFDFSEAALDADLLDAITGI